MKPKNRFIEMCRFLAAISMLFHHTDMMGFRRIAWGSWIFVEFFFVLSGYFMTKHFENRANAEEEHSEKEILLYLGKKLGRLVPYSCMGIFIGAFVQIQYYKGEGIPKVVEIIMNIPTNILFLASLGLTHYNFDAPLWYVTGLLIAMPLLILFMVKRPRLYKYLGSWILPLILYTVMFCWHGNIQYWNRHSQIHCLMRAFAGLMAGSVSYYLSKLVGKLSLSHIVRLIVTCLEVIAFCALFIVSFHYECLNVSFACVLLFVIIICFSFSGIDCTQSIVPRCAEWLGALSTPLYCLHRPVYDAVKYYCNGVNPYIRLYIGFGYTFILSIFMLLLLDVISRRKVVNNSISQN